MNDVMGDDWANRNAKAAEDMGVQNTGMPDPMFNSNIGTINAQVDMRNEQEAQQAMWDQQRADSEASQAEQERRLRDRMFQGNRKVGRGRASLRIDR